MGRTGNITVYPLLKRLNCPTINSVIDQSSGYFTSLQKNLNFSGFSDLVFVKKKSKKTSWVKKPDPQVKDHYIHTCKTEAQALANRLQKPEGRLRQLIMVFTRIRKVNYYSSMCCFSVLLSPFKLMNRNVMYSNLFASFAATCMD